MNQKMVYQWNPATSWGNQAVDAQVVGEKLEAIRLAHDGILRNEDVVAAAIAPECPLHPLFEWDDTVAAHRYRLRQSQEVIKKINVVVTKNGVDSAPVRAFISLKAVDEKSESAYHSIVVVANDPVKREQLLKNALHELNIWRQRYAELQEFMRLFKAIDQMILVLGKEVIAQQQVSA